MGKKIPPQIGFEKGALVKRFQNEIIGRQITTFQFLEEELIDLSDHLSQNFGETFSVTSTPKAGSLNLYLDSQSIVEIEVRSRENKESIICRTKDQSMACDSEHPDIIGQIATFICDATPQNILAKLNQSQITKKSQSTPSSGPTSNSQDIHTGGSSPGVFGEGGPPTPMVG